MGKKRKNNLPSIPLAELNCLHCGLNNTDCKEITRVYPATGRPCPPSVCHCLHIWKNYIPEPENEPEVPIQVGIPVQAEFWGNPKLF